MIKKNRRKNECENAKNFSEVDETFCRTAIFEIADWSNKFRLAEDEVREAVDDYSYGQNVISPPKDFLNNVDIVGIVDTGDGRKRWSVIFELWMDKEEKSDLSVELFFIDPSKEYYDIEVNNIHVM